MLLRFIDVMHWLMSLVPRFYLIGRSMTLGAWLSTASQSESAELAANAAIARIGGGRHLNARAVGRACKNHCRHVWQDTRPCLQETARGTGAPSSDGVIIGP
jgi:hypothetical protein